MERDGFSVGDKYKAKYEELGKLVFSFSFIFNYHLHFINKRRLYYFEILPSFEIDC
jgi:hypothetical protein